VRLNSRLAAARSLVLLLLMLVLLVLLVLVLVLVLALLVLVLVSLLLHRQCPQPAQRGCAHPQRQPAQLQIAQQALAHRWKAQQSAQRQMAPPLPPHR
jgi:flagellar basal body-associated protein FliL